MTTNRFEKLLQDAKKLPNISSKSETPQLDRDIYQIAKESQIIASKMNTNQDLTSIGHYFLAQSGSNTQETISNLKTLDTKFTFEPSQVAKKTDVEAYLNQVYKEYEKQTIEGLKHDRVQTFLESMDEGLHSNWQKAKTQILQNWELEQDNKKFGRQTQGKEQIVQTLKKKALAYASVVKDINLNRLLLNKIPVINKFKALSDLSDCTNTQRATMLEAWDIASYLTNEKRETGEYIQGVYTRQHYDKTMVIQMNRRLIHASKTWLEKQYHSLAEEVVFKNANVVKVGGTPSISHRLRAFMEISFKTMNKSWFNPNIEICNGMPIWLFIFILLRSGYPDLAIQFIENNQTLFASSPGFPLYFEEYFSSPDHRLSEESRKKVFTQYRIMKYGNKAVDPVKILLYQILGRCELNSTYPCEVISTIEDYIWLRLTLVRESLNEEQTEHERYRLVDLQRTIAEHDFKLNEVNPWLYFKILLLTLQFEKATNFLYMNENFKVEAMHFGIGFAYHGLMRIPNQPRDNTLDLLITELDGNTCCLNFARLINQYIQLFLFKSPEDALQYIYLITLYRTDDMKFICHEQLSNYIIETDEECYKSLLGETAAKTGYHHQGIIDKFEPLLGLDFEDTSGYRKTILDRIAEGFQDKGRFKDAVSVYESI
ncbi:MAG: Nup93/Nic96-domain-containing protein [Benjaminiella poitrasii]|nr:MAG: Nup93/Nic96-domain-containing protein [Benjaminiella poitrasii]